MIFLSFANEFNFTRTLKHLFAFGTDRNSQKLCKVLVQHYGASDARLYHNGRSALSDTIKTLVPAGSQVAINGLTCYAVPQAVKSANCQPVYVDINHQDFNFDIAKLTKTLQNQPEIKAIIIQNHLGIPADIAAIEKLAQKHQLVIIEDLAHCAGSHYKDGREVGTVGAAAALSFGKGKAIDTTEGGALVLRSPDAKLSARPQKPPRPADRLRDRFYPILGWLIRKTYPIGLGKLIAAAAFKTHAITRSAEGRVQPGIRLTHWQAKLALKQFQNLSQITKFRTKFAAAYHYPETAALLRIPLLVNNRNQLLVKLRQKGIYLDDSWYQVPVAPARYYSKADFPESDCPVTVQVAGQMLNLPLLPKSQLQSALKIIQPEIISHDR